jgi:hypothetical protein
LSRVTLPNLLATPQSQVPPDIRTEHVAAYAVDQNLGRDIALFILVKGFRQLEQNERYTRILSEGGPIGRADAREYNQGVAFLTFLADDSITDVQYKSSELAFFEIEPNWIDFYAERLVLTAGNELLLFDLNTRESVRVPSPWFGQLHSAVFSPDGGRIIVTSTGFESIIELDVMTRMSLWHWCAWHHGLSQGVSGHTIHTKSLAGNAAGGPEVQVLGEPVNLSRGTRPFGLPVRLQACHINQSIYDAEDIFAVLFHQGAIIQIDRTSGSHAVRLSGLKYPHGLFRVGLNEYIISDTQSGRFCFLNDVLEITRIVTLDGLPGIRPDRQRATEWLQCTDRVGDTLFAVVDTHRSKIHLIDVDARTRRSIDVPPDWSVQRAVAAPTKLANMQSR